MTSTKHSSDNESKNCSRTNIFTRVRLFIVPDAFKWYTAASLISVRTTQSEHLLDLMNVVPLKSHSGQLVIYFQSFPSGFLTMIVLFSPQFFFF